MPPTHRRTTVRAKVDGATYSTKAQLSSASLLGAVAPGTFSLPTQVAQHSQGRPGSPGKPL